LKSSLGDGRTFARLSKREALAYASLNPPGN
jgi:hypothetical protein